MLSSSKRQYHSTNIHIAGAAQAHFAPDEGHFGYVEHAIGKLDGDVQPIKETLVSRSSIRSGGTMKGAITATLLGAALGGCTVVVQQPPLDPAISQSMVRAVEAGQSMQSAVVNAVPTPRLGAALMNMPAAWASMMPPGARSGAWVTFVSPDTPAARAGLVPGDILVSWDDKSISSNDDVVRYIAATAGGVVVPVKVRRMTGAVVSLDIRMDAAPSPNLPATGLSASPRPTQSVSPPSPKQEDIMKNKAAAAVVAGVMAVANTGNLKAGEIGEGKMCLLHAGSKLPLAPGLVVKSASVRFVGKESLTKGGTPMNVYKGEVDIEAMKTTAKFIFTCPVLPSSDGTGGALFNSAFMMSVAD